MTSPSGQRWGGRPERAWSTWSASVPASYAAVCAKSTPPRVGSP